MIEITTVDLEIVKNILDKYLLNVGCEVEVRAFGSRVNHHPKKYSDLDLVVVSKEKIPLKTLFAIKEELAESQLLFRVDLLDWNRISDEFRRVVEKNYEVIWSLCSR